MDERGKLNYASSVDYKLVDPHKILMQREGLATSVHLQEAGFSEVSASRGETAYVIDMGDYCLALVQEGLGSKNLVADEVRKFTGRSHYDSVAQDAVASIVNDIIPVGARPLVVDAYWSMHSYDWLNDGERSQDLIRGWRQACDEAGVSWGGGETQSLPRIIQEGKIELAGSGIGIIRPKEKLTLGDKLEEGDQILLVEASGVGANGLSLAQEVAPRLPNGYATKLPDGKTYGESLLVPTHIYAKFVGDLFEAGVDIHYMVNITGHGWRKLMRAKPDFSYVIQRVPTPHPVFDIIQEQSGNDNTEMYGNFNMGAGFAVFLKMEDVSKAMERAAKNGFKSLRAGHIEKGEKQVLIGPKNVIFKAESLAVR